MAGARPGGRRADGADCDEAAQFVTAGGSIRSATAIASAATHGAPAWRPVGHLLEAPGISRVAGHAYGWIAAHRYQLPGGTAACARPLG